MDPFATISAILHLVNYLRAASDKVQGNQKQCHRLADHAEDMLKLIEDEVSNDLPLDALTRLTNLKQTLQDLNSTLSELADKPMLKKILWREDIAGRITAVYQNLSDAVAVFNLGSRIDLRRFQADNEEARRADAARVEENFKRSQKNDYEILQHLEIHKAQMQEAMVALHNHLLNMRDSGQRRFLENGKHAMERFSGGLQPTPDLFTITSLDVIIYQDKKIGEGSFGQVYEAEWQGSRVAVKVLDKSISPFIFQQEIEIWKRLRHPNILELFGACSIANPPFSVCALKSHGDALSYLRQLPSADRCKLLHEASLGLKYLHQNGVVHGDLKASNILIDEHGHACLCDFGLSKLRSHTTTLVRPLDTSSNQGTPRWMSPEQMSLGVINKMTDIYSFGMTTYEVFTGVPPFANTVDSLLLGLVVDRGIRPPRPSEQSIVLSGLHDDMWKLVQECWAQKPEDRPVVATVVLRLSAMSPGKPVDSNSNAADISFFANNHTPRNIPVESSTHTSMVELAAPSYPTSTSLLPTNGSALLNRSAQDLDVSVIKAKQK